MQGISSSIILSLVTKFAFDEVFSKNNEFIRLIDSSIESSNKNIIENVSDIMRDNINFMSNQATINKDMDNILEKSKDINEKHQETMLKLHNSSGEMQSSFEKINVGMREYSQYFDEIKDKNIEINKSLTKNYSNVSERFSDVAESLDKSIGAIDTSFVNKISDISVQSVKVLEKYERLNENIIPLIEKFESFAKTEEATQKIWHEYKNSFEGIAMSMEKSVIDLTGIMKNRANEVYRTHDLEMAKGVEILKNAIQEIVVVEETIETINDSFDKLSKTLDKIGIALEEKAEDK